MSSERFEPIAVDMHTTIDSEMLQVTAACKGCLKPFRFEDLRPREDGGYNIDAYCGCRGPQRPRLLVKVEVRFG